jgi:hypothetical protein
MPTGSKAISLKRCAKKIKIWGIACCIMGSAVHGATEDYKFPHLPGSTLLFGWIGTVLHGLTIVTPGETVNVLPEPGQLVTGDGTPIFPSISLDGRLIACVRLRPFPPFHIVLATFSIPDRQWTEYADAEHVYAVSISPDKSKLAFVSREAVGKPILLRILDTETRIARVAVTAEQIAIDSRPSWSPNGDSLAYEVNPTGGGDGEYQRSINVLEVATGKTKRLSEGQSPAWSPSGEWIAYFVRSEASPNDRLFPFPKKCMMMHPDGTGVQDLYGTSSWFSWPAGQKHFVDAPVWSPNSKQLLLNELSDLDSWRMNLDTLDIATRKLERRFKNAPPVLGWAPWG